PARRLSFPLALVIVVAPAPQTGFARSRSAAALRRTQILLLVGGFLRVHPVVKFRLFGLNRRGVIARVQGFLVRRRFHFLLGLGFGVPRRGHERAEQQVVSSFENLHRRLRQLAGL